MIWDKPDNNPALPGYVIHGSGSFADHQKTNNTIRNLKPGKTYDFTVKTRYSVEIIRCEPDGEGDHKKEKLSIDITKYGPAVIADKEYKSDTETIDECIQGNLLIPEVFFSAVLCFVKRHDTLH